MSNPRLPDINTLLGFGIDPSVVDKLCGYMSNKNKACNYPEAIKKLLRKMDRQQYIRRFTWKNLPNDIDQELVERILYYRGQACLFYVKEIKRFFFLPFAYIGDINVYGRYEKIKPQPFTGKGEVDKGIFIPNLELTPIYDIKEAFEMEDPSKCAVIFRSYSQDYSQTILNEQVLMEPVLDLMSQAIPMARTSLLANSGIKGVRVNNANDYSNVLAMNSSIENAAFTGEFNIPVTAQTEFQELTDKGAMQADQFLMYMQSLDNFRLSCYGLTNGGLFEKKGAYVNDQATSNIQANTDEVYNDALECRKKACDIANGLFALGLTIEGKQNQQCCVNPGMEESDQEYEGGNIDE